MILAVFLVSLSASAQTVIKGKVTDDITGEPLIGANVIIKGTTQGTTADLDGNFELKVNQALPVTLVVTYLGYKPFEFVASEAGQSLKIKLQSDEVVLGPVDVVDSRLTDKQKEAPTTIESMDLLAIKETPAANFYDGLGSLKGVDLTAASMGFKIVNTRGFNSTSPVRSLQLIDGVDNQAPGLNFSVGNFAGASELDVLKVELIVGANSALYGPNAFNGVIAMKTKSPFLFKGLTVMGKVGERNLRETAIRYADAFQNKKGEDKFAFKLNFSYFQADDWEADNYDPTEQSNVGASNFGGFDAVNIYGDENAFGNLSDFNRRNSPGLGIYHRTGYREVDLVDYDTENLKAAGSLHYKITKEIEAKYEMHYGTGTTVYQGDNRYSLKDLQIWQHVAEVSQEDKFFIRAYNTSESAGNSYDAVFTALLLQDAVKDGPDWTRDYNNFWNIELEDRVLALPGFPDPNNPQYTQFWFGDSQDSIYNVVDQVFADNADSLIFWHQLARDYADGIGNPVFENQPRLVPGTPAFDSAFASITSKRTFQEGGSGFFDQSALSHIQGQYKFEPEFMDILLGGSYRQYRPNSKGTIFLDTGDAKITNYEYGFYSSLEKRVWDESLILTATGRVDKNENFDFLFSPAASAVYLYDEKSTFRVSFSSAIRNPTLQDQFLFYNVGRAILLGNINGVDSLVTTESLGDYFSELNADTLEYFDVDPIRPEGVRTIEFGFKGVLFKNVFMDASYYYSWYRNFLGYKLGAAVNFDANGFLNQSQFYRVSANSPDIVTTQGFSLGLNYYFKKYYSLFGNYTWNVLDRRGSDDPIIPAYNTPEHKFNIGVSGRDMVVRLGGMTLKNVGFNVNYKWIEGFLFEGSPQFTGEIPTYDMVDAQVNYNWKKGDTVFKLGASNLLNKKNFQTYGGPRIGRMAYFSVTVGVDDLSLSGNRKKGNGEEIQPVSN